MFGITVDYLLNNENKLPLMAMRINLNKCKYKSKINSYSEILMEYFSESYKIF